MPDLVILTLEPDERGIVAVPRGRTVAWRQQIGSAVEMMRAEATSSVFEAPRCTTGWKADVPGEVTVSSPWPLAPVEVEKVWLFLWPDAYGLVWIPVDDDVVEAAG